MKEIQTIGRYTTNNSTLAEHTSRMFSYCVTPRPCQDQQGHRSLPKGTPVPPRERETTWCWRKISMTQITRSYSNEIEGCHVLVRLVFPSNFRTKVVFETTQLQTSKGSASPTWSGFATPCHFSLPSWSQINHCATPPSSLVPAKSTFIYQPEIWCILGWLPTNNHWFWGRPAVVISCHIRFAQ